MIEFETSRNGPFLIQSSPSLNLPAWKDWAGWNQTGSTVPWLERDSRTHAARFFRAISAADLPPRERAPNFRLLDDGLKSWDLAYHQTNGAIVLVFIDSRIVDLAAREMVDQMTTTFEGKGVSFWLIDSAPEDASAPPKTINTNPNPRLPLLSDSAQLVARVYGIEATPTAVAIDSASGMVLYRGPIASSASPSELLKNALEEFLQSKPLTVFQAPESGFALTFKNAAKPSYAIDVAPLLQTKCAACHSQGNIAPWALTDYQTVRTYAPLIREKLLTQQMPPWHADPRFGKFSNDASLKPAESAMLVDWIEHGALRGDGADPLAEAPPPPLDYPVTWPAELGKPDFIVSIPKQTLPATGEIAYRYLEVTTTIPSNVWLRAAVVRPGNRRSVHHCLVFLGNRLDVLLGSAGGLGGFFAGYVPGVKATVFPGNTGKFLTQGQVITFQMHYTATGQTETDQTEIGFYTMPAPPALELKTGSAYSVNIDIPPGAPEVVLQAQTVPSKTKDILLYEMSPHMHYRGSWFRFEARYPNGTSEILLSVPKYEFHWQTLYRLAEPKRLPAGTAIRCTGAFDNSARNPENPDPTQRVRFGEQTDDEMFIGYFNYSEAP